MELEKFVNKVISNVEKSIGKEVEIKFHLNLIGDDGDVHVLDSVESPSSIEFKVSLKNDEYAPPKVEIEIMEQKKRD